MPERDFIKLMDEEYVYPREKKRREEMLKKSSGESAPPENVDKPKESVPSENIETPKKSETSENIETPKKSKPSENVQKPKKTTSSETPKKSAPTDNVETPKKSTRSKKIETPKKSNPEAAPSADKNEAPKSSGKSAPTYRPALLDLETPLSEFRITRIYEPPPPQLEGIASHIETHFPDPGDYIQPEKAGINERNTIPDPEPNRMGSNEKRSRPVDVLDNSAPEGPDVPDLSKESPKLKIYRNTGNPGPPRNHGPQLRKKSARHFNMKKKKRKKN